MYIVVGKQIRGMIRAEFFSLLVLGMVMSSIISAKVIHPKATVDIGNAVYAIYIYFNRSVTSRILIN
jgi:hypothetical protein